MIFGQVKRFDREKNFGWIERDDRQRDVFVHQREVDRAGIDVRVGDRLEFDLAEDRHGRVHAVDLRRIR